MNKKTSKQEQSSEHSNPKTGGATHPRGDNPSQAAGDIFAIEFLEKQHTELRNLFARMKSETDHSGRRNLLERVATLLRNHTAIEDRHFYTGVLNKSTEKLVTQFRKEHKEAEELLGKLYQYESFEADFLRKFEKLVEAVEDHMLEEENELFPLVAEEVSPTTLKQIGHELEKSYRTLTHAGPGVGDKVNPVEKNLK